MGRRVILLTAQSIVSVTIGAILLLFWNSSDAALLAGLLFLAALSSAVACIALAVEPRREPSST